MKKVSANAIADAIFDFLSANHKEKNNIIAIGCDGTAVNIRAKGGAIRMIELKLNKPVYWFICQLHANKLPFRHLFQTCKMLDRCEKVDVVNFEPVPFDLFDMSEIDLSTDQQYLYGIHLSVSAGKLSEGLNNDKNPGKMAHSRWLTTANRILRLYVPTVELSQTLKTIVEYIMKVYVPVLFCNKKYFIFSK